MRTLPDWYQKAACKGADQDAWFPTVGYGNSQTVQEARVVCFSCPVQQECLNFALEHNEMYGIWGGYSPKARNAIRRGENRKPPRKLKPQQPCQVKSCGEPAYGRGWCSRHYQKWRKYGNPTSSGNRGRNRILPDDATLIELLEEYPTKWVARKYGVKESTVRDHATRLRKAGRLGKSSRPSVKASP